MLDLGYSNSCGYSNLSNSLNHFDKYSVIVCDYNSMDYYDTAYGFRYSFRYNGLIYSYAKIIFNIVNFNNIFNMLILLFIFVSALFSSVAFVSRYVYSSMINQFVDKYNLNKELYDYDPYLFEYLDEFNALKSYVLGVDFLNSLKYKYVKLVTPKGEIIMTYNYDYSNFEYYCKKSNIIDFTYLDVVSRIFVVKNDCKNIYIDKCENYDYGLDCEIIDDDVNADVDADVNVDADADVNDHANDANDHANDANDHANDANDHANAVKEKEKESCIFYNKLNKNANSKDDVEYVSNKYKYKGTIEDFYSYCEINKYKISYSISDSDSINNDCSCITFSIVKEEENTSIKTCELYKTHIGFKEFKQYQKF